MLSHSRAMKHILWGSSKLSLNISLALCHRDQTLNVLHKLHGFITCCHHQNTWPLHCPVKIFLWLLAPKENFEQLLLFSAAQSLKTCCNFNPMPVLPTLSGFSIWNAEAQNHCFECLLKKELLSLFAFPFMKIQGFSSIILCFLHMYCKCSTSQTIRMADFGS